MLSSAYDEAEHERCEQTASEVTARSDDERTGYNGSVEYEGDDSTEQFLDQCRQIQLE